jgi:hypothetical protein
LLTVTETVPGPARFETAIPKSVPSIFVTATVAPAATALPSST